MPKKSPDFEVEETNLEEFLDEEEFRKPVGTREWTNCEGTMRPSHNP